MEGDEWEVVDVPLATSDYNVPPIRARMIRQVKRDAMNKLHFLKWVTDSQHHASGSNMSLTGFSLVWSISVAVSFLIFLSSSLANLA